jgi:hypothetical protein
MDRVISTEEGKKLADTWNAAFLEASAKENQVSVTWCWVSLAKLSSFPFI